MKPPRPATMSIIALLSLTGGFLTLLFMPMTVAQPIPLPDPLPTLWLISIALIGFGFICATHVANHLNEEKYRSLKDAWNLLDTLNHYMHRHDERLQRLEHPNLKLKVDPENPDTSLTSDEEIKRAENEAYASIQKLLKAIKPRSNSSHTEKCRNEAQIIFGMIGGFSIGLNPTSEK